MAKRTTNVQAVRRLMEYSKCGALQQAFILTAIEKYAAQCIAAGAAKFDSGLLSGEAWIACATEARDAIAAHLASQS
jgi:hypothetical protein